MHRRDHFRAEKILQDRLFKNPKIEVIWDHAVEEIVGTENPKSVTGVKLKNTKTGAITERAADGVFIAIGHAPATQLFKGQLEMTHSGISADAAGFDRDGRPRRLCGRRRQGRGLSPGGDGGGHGLHGGARSRALLRDAGDRGRDRGGGVARARYLAGHKNVVRAFDTIGWH